MKYFVTRLLMVLIAVSFLTDCASYQKYDPVAIQSRWESDIAVFDELSAKGYPESPIVFYGSSSIRMWKSLAEDVAPFTAVNRGFGGCTLPDAAYYAKRVLTPIDYQALVLFVANDIWGNEKDKTPKEMKKLVDFIVKTSRRHRPDAPIFLIEVTQTPARAHLMDEWDAANAMLREYADDHSYVHFIPTREYYVKDDGSIRKDLFIADGLHQNEAGYAIWKERVNYYLRKELGQ